MSLLGFVMVVVVKAVVCGPVLLILDCFFGSTAGVPFATVLGVVLMWAVLGREETAVVVETGIVRDLDFMRGERLFA
ncbi:hypothetical protein K402DRAFT_48796 [Aulographum hederae CBS 113979]|uniref:Uncharacterized protein n=1 Tax=Aulographum hederae CBS 113979 TaxID=1176131 RepID=A0A6G1H398_9PEZI|nr:hypothetical protein K402DRAFT_48796 [Aulographum hederae CBS 113979]